MSHSAELPTTQDGVLFLALTLLMVTSNRVHLLRSFSFLLYYIVLICWKKTVKSVTDQTYRFAWSVVCSVSELKNGIIQISGNERRPEKEREKWIFAMNCRWKCSNGHSSACRSLAYKTMGGTVPGGQRPIDLLALLLPNKHTTHTHSLKCTIIDIELNWILTSNSETISII